MEGWPTELREVTEEARAFWTFREEMCVEQNVIYKVNRAIIPKSLRSKFLQHIHAGHQGEIKCLLRAKQSVYWPGITTEIRDIVQRCSSCQKHATKQQPYPEIQHPVPERPWQKVASDLFLHGSQKYVLVVDYFSKFPVVRSIDAETSEEVSGKLSAIFCEMGVPEEIVTDNGPCFVGPEMRNRMKSLKIKHTTSSPNYPGSNGQAERYVGYVKSVMTKCIDSGENPAVGLLQMRNTPIDIGIPSPMDIMRGVTSFNPELPNRKEGQPIDMGQVRDNLVIRQKKNSKAPCRLPPTILQPGDEIRHYDSKLKIWKEGKVIQKTEEPQSYKIKDAVGGILRRTQTHLKRKRMEPIVIEENNEEDEAEIPELIQENKKLQVQTQVPMEAPKEGNEPPAERATRGKRRSRLHENKKPRILSQTTMDEHQEAAEPVLAKSTRCGRTVRVPDRYR